MPRPSIVHLIGFPAAGKLTIARALASLAERRGRRFVVVDNHLTANVILAVLDVDGVRELPAGVWDRVDEIRAVLLRAIEELSPPSWSFVFTNVLTEHNPADRLVIERVARLSTERSSHYVPVRVHCEIEALLRRVDNDDRRQRMKSIDPVGVRALIDSTQLVDVAAHNPIELDTTYLGPDDAAARILDHIDALD